MNPPDKLQKSAERVLKANNRLAELMAKDQATKRERRNGLLLKLGVLAEQMFLAGDSVLLGRFETAALAQYGERKVDRVDFELDGPLNYFDRTREEALVRRSTRAEAAASSNSLRGRESSGFERSATAPVDATKTAPSARSSPSASTAGPEHASPGVVAR